MLKTTHTKLSEYCWYFGETWRLCVTWCCVMHFWSWLCLHSWHHTKGICWFGSPQYYQTLIRDIKVSLAEKIFFCYCLLFLLSCKTVLGQGLIETDFEAIPSSPIFISVWSLLSPYLNFCEKLLSTLELQNELQITLVRYSLHLEPIMDDFELFDRRPQIV